MLSLHECVLQLELSRNAVSYGVPRYSNDRPNDRSLFAQLARRMPGKARIRGSALFADGYQESHAIRASNLNSG